MSGGGLTRSAENLKAYLTAIAGRHENQAVVEHLRARQSELWTKSGSVLAFDGLLIASLLVLVSGDNRALMPNDPLEIVAFYAGLVLLFGSALLTMIAINQSGRYPPGETAETYINEFKRVMDRTDRLYGAGSLACLLGTLLFFYVLFSCLLTSGSFELPDLSPVHRRGDFEGLERAETIIAPGGGRFCLSRKPVVRRRFPPARPLRMVPAVTSARGPCPKAKSCPSAMS